MQIHKNDLIRFIATYKESGLYKVKHVAARYIITYTGEVVPLARITAINGTKVHRN